MFSECGNTESPENGCGHPKVGVANEISRGCPGLSSHKLGNYVNGKLILLNDFLRLATMGMVTLI